MGVLMLLPAVVVAIPVPADAVDRYITSQMERGHIPGAAVAIVEKGRVVKLAAYGLADLEWNAAATPKTAWQLASATKPLTGMALMLLVQDGRLSLDDPVSRHLPEAPAAWRDMTIRHLATHTSGLRDDLGEGVRTLDAAIAASAKLPLSHAPGERSAYGFTDYVVLMRVMERAGGRPFVRLLDETLFAPIGMTATRFSDETEDGPIRTARLVPGRADTYRWQDGEQKRFDFLYAPWAYAAGGLYSSAEDLARWAQGLDEGRPLRAELQDQMWKAPTLRDGRAGSFAVGGQARTYRGRRVVGHSGGPALADVMRFVDEKLTVVVLANQQRLLPYLAEGVADLYVPAPSEPASPSVPDRDPAVTERVRRVLAGAGAGRVDRDLLAPEARDRMGPMLDELGPQITMMLGPLDSLAFVDEAARDGARVRRYRARHGAKPVLWTVVLDPEGRVVSVEPVSE